MESNSRRIPYDTPELKISRLDSMDVISTSGGTNYSDVTDNMPSGTWH